jgi:very-short-patch-repair endonuclease
VGHDLADGAAVQRVDSAPVVDPVSAWCQSATLLSLDALVAVGDALAGSWSPHPAARRRPTAELARAVEARAGTRGAGRLRDALGLVRPRVESPKETELRLLLLRAGLPEPEVNMKRRDGLGRYLGKPDLSWAEHLVSAEYEGDGHRSDPQRWRNDIDRAERFTDAGWRVVRVTQRDLHGAGAERLILRLSRLLVS